jgi:hypothetical protein
MLMSFSKRARDRLGFTLIWHSNVWILSKSRNDFIFVGKSVKIEQLLDKIQFLT